MTWPWPWKAVALLNAKTLLARAFLGVTLQSQQGPEEHGDKRKRGSKVSWRFFPVPAWIVQRGNRAELRLAVGESGFITAIQKTLEEAKEKVC